MLIGVTGQTGSGKSTFSRSLSENLIDVECIHCDKILLPNILSRKDKLIELYGKDIICNDSLNKKLFMQYPEKAKIVHSLIDSTIIEQLLSTINSALKKHKYVIVDFYRLPEYDEIWKLCDVHILIKSENTDARYTHLLERLNNSNTGDFKKNYHITAEDLKSRDQLASDHNLFSYDYIVTNNYDESLFEEAKKIAIKLQTLNLWIIIYLHKKGF